LESSCQLNEITVG